MSTVEIPLCGGEVALIDEADHQLVRMHFWHHRDGYAASNVINPDGTRTTMRMHRFLLGLTDPKVHIDHINGNGLDNRRSNLRVATPSQNSANRRKIANATSPYKGVYWQKNRRWRAVLTVDRRHISLGMFDDPADAARAYDAAALEHFGPFARLNFPAVRG